MPLATDLFLRIFTLVLGASESCSPNTSIAHGEPRQRRENGAIGSLLLSAKVKQQYSLKVHEMNQILEKSVSEMAAAGERFCWSNRKAYANWLAQTYYYVRHSTRLLALAAARFSQSPEGDSLHLRFGAHIGEEKRHELLALHDLKVLGMNLQEFPEMAQTRMFYEPQYYKVEHISPTVLFGYILPLEVIAPQHGHQVIEVVTKAFGKSCDRFLHLHAQEDVSHVEKALKLVNQLPSEQLQLIEENMQQTSMAYVALLDAMAV